MKKTKKQTIPATNDNSPQITDIITPIKSSETRAIRFYILMVLKKLPSCSTIEFKRLGVHALAPRVWDLRHKFNCEIETVAVDEYDDVGVFHKGIARYVLKSCPATI